MALAENSTLSKDEQITGWKKDWIQQIFKKILKLIYLAPLMCLFNILYNMLNNIALALSAGKEAPAENSTLWKDYK
jgi:hypothetical protein